MGTDRRIGAEIAGHRIQSIVGYGGMGVVYLAEHLVLKQLRAVKLLKPEFAQDPPFRERFLRESELAGSIEHPNVIPVFDAGEADGVLYLVMRYVRGGDLGQELHGGKRLEPQRALAITGAIADALDTAHRRGLIHRDVKPRNILLEAVTEGNPTERIYLSDFGLVRRMQSTTNLTTPGRFVGTVEYAAPEQFRGNKLNGGTDQYSLACVLYECLTGQVPFERDSDAAIMYAHLRETPRGPSELRPDLPVALDVVVQRALSKSPSDRYGSCMEFVAAARTATVPAAEHSREKIKLDAEEVQANRMSRPSRPQPPTVTDRPIGFEQLPVSPISKKPPPPPRPPISRQPSPTARVPAPPRKSVASLHQRGRPSRGSRRGLIAAAVGVVLVAALAAVVVATGGHTRTSTPPGSGRSSAGNPRLARSRFLSSLSPQGPSPIVAAARISGFLFSHSLTYAPSFQPVTSAYALPGSFATFSSQLGWEPDANNFASQCPSVTFKVLANDGSAPRQLLDQTVYPGRGDNVSVPLENVRHIELQTIFPSDCSGTAVWGNPALLGSGPTLSGAGRPEVTSAPTGFLAGLDPALMRFEGSLPGVATETLNHQAFPESLTYQPLPGGGAATATYELGGSYARFTVTLGWLPDANNFSSGCPAVTFQVLGDVTDSLFNVQIAPGHPVPEDLPVKNVGEIRLVTTFPSDCSGVAVWGSPKVVGTG